MKIKWLASLATAVAVSVALAQSGTSPGLPELTDPRMPADPEIPQPRKEVPELPPAEPLLSFSDIPLSGNPSSVLIYGETNTNAAPGRTNWIPGPTNRSTNTPPPVTNWPRTNLPPPLGP